jgi:hypothetical protein
MQPIDHRGTAQPSEEVTPGTSLRRRGALAGLSVVLAGLVAKASELPVRAADGGNFLLGRGNQADSRTQLDKSGAVNDVALVVTNASGGGIQGTSESTDATIAGVRGEGVTVGVFGETISPSGIAGVMGNGRATGVTGTSTDGTGVEGHGSTGVSGFANTGGGIGVFGQGVLAGVGVLGQAGASTPNSYGVFSNGRFGATGPITALIGERVVFALASPDSWIIDVGSATLDPHGRATVPLAPDFAALIDTSTYQVFVTPYAESEGLFVGRRTPTSFDVASHHGGREANIAFGFQVVGKRKDIAVSRPVTTTPPAAPAPPKKPDIPGMP